MTRRKNTKRIDPRYFLNETVNRGEEGKEPGVGGQPPEWERKLAKSEPEGPTARSKRRHVRGLEDPDVDVEELDEGALNIALDIAGLIPGVGEFADVANAALYAKDGKWLFAALSLVSVIPALGDVVGKGGKISMWAAKNFPKGAKAIAKHGPEVIKVIELLQKHAATVANLFDAVAQDERVKGYLGGDEGVAEMQAALDQFAAGGAKEWPSSTAQAAQE